VTPLLSSLPPESQPGPEITRLLRAAQSGDTAAADALLEAVYRQLRELAGAAMGQHAGHVLQPTALVHEAWLKLEGHLDGLEDRRHFLRVAARAMRQVLANQAEAERAEKRAGRRMQFTTLSWGDVAGTESLDALVLDDVLTKLGDLNERHARVVELRFLCALTIAETADALGVSHATVETDWAMARAWLRRELRGS